MSLNLIILDETSTGSVSSDDDDLEHIYCECDPDRGLCGADLSDTPDLGYWRPDDEDTCVVCTDLSKVTCERCRT